MLEDFLDFKSILKMVFKDLKDDDIENIQSIFVEVSKHQNEICYLINNFGRFVEGMIWFGEYMKEIKLKELMVFNDEDIITQIFPISVISSVNLKKLIKLKNEFKGSTIRELFNFYIKEGNKIYIKKIEDFYEFFDIDDEKDLQYLNLKIKKKDNRFH